MQAGTGGRVANTLNSTRKGRRQGRLLAGVSAAALACFLPAAAMAANFTAFDEPSLILAINNANASPDASSTITLTSSFSVLGSTSLPTPTKALTIDTQGFTLSGVGVPPSTQGSIRFGNSFPSGMLTIEGTLRGADQG